MFIVYFEANIVYAIFQDLSKESRDISKYILEKLEDKNVPIFLHKRIKDFFTDNVQLGDNFKRQKEYISTLRTYIDSVDNKTHKNVYYLHLHIIPKDLKLIHNKTDNDKTIIDKVDELSLKIFTLYDSSESKKDTKLKTLKKIDGKTFLDLELSFYLQELNKLHNCLLTYKRSLKDKVICSDKDVGIMIDSLNNIENNPLKRYQFVTVPHQRDLIIFVYSLVIFLEKERIDYFVYNDLYKNLKNTISKINNYLLKISTSRHIKKEKVTFSSLQTFFNRYKNSKEIQKNKLIYNILESIFHNQLKEGVFISKSIDMTKMFEKIVENALKKEHSSNLFIGNETKKIITGVDPYKKHLNNINHLLETGNANKAKVMQYPDFLIRESLKEPFPNQNIYHILDAKYKLGKKLLLDRTMFWQVLIYSKLFNKDIENQNLIKKIIVYAKESSINLDDISNIKINDSESIDINKCDWYNNELVFNSQIGFIGMKTLSQLPDIE